MEYLVRYCKEGDCRIYQEGWLSLQEATFIFDGMRSDIHVRFCEILDENCKTIRQYRRRK